MALPHGAIGLSAVCDYGIPYHTHLLFLIGWLIQYISSVILFFSSHGGFLTSAMN